MFYNLTIIAPPDNRLYPFEEGEEPHIHGCKIKLYTSHGLFSLPYQSKYCYSISVTTTSRNYGGQRHWFLCPLPNCERRSKKLYLHQKGIFICRKCMNIAYRTQNRCSLDRTIDKKWDLIEKFGGDSVYSMVKPPKMHKKTFAKIQKEVNRLDSLATLGIARLFGQPMAFF